MLSKGNNLFLKYTMIIVSFLRDDFFFYSKFVTHKKTLMIKYLKLLRVEQWVKNFFVFIPLFFSNYASKFLLKVFLHLLFFSLIASSIYILNDYKDIEADQKHPEKKIDH